MLGVRANASLCLTNHVYDAASEGFTWRQRVAL